MADTWILPAFANRLLDKDKARQQLGLMQDKMSVAPYPDGQPRPDSQGLVREVSIPLRDQTTQQVGTVTTDAAGSGAGPRDAGVPSTRHRTPATGGGVGA